MKILATLFPVSFSSFLKIIPPVQDINRRRFSLSDVFDKLVMDQSPADLNEITLVPSIEDNSSNSNSVNNNEPPVGISAAVVSNPINKVNSDSINSVKNDTGENGEDVETNECEGENGSKFVDAIMRRRTLTSPFHTQRSVSSDKMEAAVLAKWNKDKLI
ncbi:uncharacterized protein LOC142348015 [Convolutriloba macropyga]|uniref:uncharacterized protein LOC142348015 n=1 Tax=Convolutriloba macropyga TaxID=536237 RepID=UPI003F521A2E